MSKGEEKKYKIELRAKEGLPKKAEKKIIEDIKEKLPEAKINNIKKEADPSFIAEIVVDNIDYIDWVLRAYTTYTLGRKFAEKLYIHIDSIKSNQKQNKEKDKVDLQEYQKVNLDRWIEKSKIDIIDKDDKRRKLTFPVLIPPGKDKEGNKIPFSQIEDRIHEIHMNLAGKKLTHRKMTGNGKLVEFQTLKTNIEYKSDEGNVIKYPIGTWVISVVFDEKTWAQLEPQELIEIFITSFGGMLEANLEL